MDAVQIQDGGKLETKMTFFRHMFQFDDETKCEIFNIVQFAGLAIIPILVLNKGMKKYIPDVDEDKGSVEILFEVLAQIVVMFVGMYYIHRIVTYVPTYSGIDYQQYSVVNIIISTLVVVLSLQTKLGEKTNILIERIFELWEGNSGAKEEEVEKKNTQNTQPQQGQQQSPFPAREPLTTKQDSSGTNYDGMYANTANPMVNANTPQNAGNFPQQELMAANEALGGSFGGSMF